MRSVKGGQKTLYYVGDMTVKDLHEGFSQFEGWVSRRQIADHFGRAVSPSLVGMIERMVEQGTLLKMVHPLSNGREMFFYRLRGVGE